MFPIRDHNPALRTPWVNYVLLGLNIAVFLATLPLMTQPQALQGFYQSWAIIPANLTRGLDVYTVVSSMFLHGGWMHLIGNMLFLYIFGDNLEDQLGHVGFGIFYLVCGIGAGLAQALTDPGSSVPLIGASGAIAGVMGGYLLLFPKARVDVLLIIIIIIKIIPVPAWVMLGLWFGLQLFNGFVSDTTGGGVAYWAHSGGFLLGVFLMLPLWLKKGGPAYWQRSHGHPENPEAQYTSVQSRVPNVRRKQSHQRSSIPTTRRRK